MYFLSRGLPSTTGTLDNLAVAPFGASRLSYFLLISDAFHQDITSMSVLVIARGAACRLGRKTKVE